MQALFHGGPYDGDRQVVNIGAWGARPTRVVLPSLSHDNIFYVYKLWVEHGTRLYYRLEKTLDFDPAIKAESCDE